MTDVIFQAFISTLALVITTVGGFAIKNYLIPFLNNKNLTFWVKEAVIAAEKYFNERPGLGEQKKEFVKNFLSTNLNLHITDEQLDLIIDSTVESIFNPIKNEPIYVDQIPLEPAKPVLPPEEIEVPDDVVVEEPKEEAVKPDFIEDKDLVAEEKYGVYETEEVVGEDKPQE